MEFHHAATRRCNHQLLLEMVGKLQSQTRILIFNTKRYRSDKVPDSVSHRAILEGIRSGDPLAAEEIVRRHIIDAGSSLVKRMEEVQRVENAPLPEGQQSTVWPTGAGATLVGGVAP
jgi:DNA-binding GntR family transcriptional regulator